MAAEEDRILGSPGVTPGAIVTRMQDAASRTDLCPCAKFQLNPSAVLG